MNWVSVLELSGAGFATLGLLLTLRRDFPLPGDIRTTLLVLLGTMALLHLLDVIEWLGVPEADWLGDTLKVVVPVAWLVFLFAVTRTELANHLRMNAGQLRLLIQENPTAIAIVDDAGRLTLANDAWHSLHGSTAELLGQPLSALGGQPGHTWDAIVQQALDTGVARHGEQEFDAEATNSSTRLQWSVRPWLGPDETRGAILVVSRVPSVDPNPTTSPDNQERSRALEELGVAASGVAHDINNLLTVISMHSEVLHLMKGQDPEVMQSSLESIQQAIGTASSMTRGLLMFSKLKPLELELLDLGALVRANARLLDDVLQGRARLVIQTDPAVWVRANTSALQQILLNLVVNARDASSERGLITLRAKLTPRGPALEVEDTGSGIPAEVLSRLFEPFFTTKRQNGTGLGLAVVDRLARAQEARVEVNSVLGKGSKFTVSFPPVAFTLASSDVRSVAKGPS